MSPGAVRVLADAAEVARAAAGRVVEIGTQAIAERGAFRLALSGGSTPGLLYRLLAFGAGGTLDWPKVTILFADERAVPAGHRDSNYRLVYETLVEPLRLTAAQVHGMRADADELEAAAREYEAHLAEPLDLLLLGIGEDGHTASLFPGSRLVDVRLRRVAVVLAAPKPPPRRLTVTSRTIGEARAVLMLANGDPKAEAVMKALADSGETRDCPARLARAGEWLVDREAGVYLSETR